MPYDSTTGLYSSGLPSLSIPDNLSLDQFLFKDIDTSKEDPLWLIDAVTGHQLTRRQARDRSLAIAKAFSSLYGLGKDGTVVLFSSNELDYATTIWGTFRAQGIVSCANPGYGPEELAHQLSLVNGFHPVKVLVTHPASLQVSIDALKIAKLPESIIVLMRRDENADALSRKFKTIEDVIQEARHTSAPPEYTMKNGEARTKLAFLSFSSGTTGLPKAVAIPHFSFVSNVLQTEAYWGATRPFTPYDPVTKKGDIVMGVLPFFHIYGLLVVLHTSVFQKNPVVVINKFTLAGFLEAIQRWKITVLYIVPPQVVMMVKSPIVDDYDLSSLSFGMTGAAPLTAETMLALRTKFPNIVFGQGYGMTETCTLVTLYDPSLGDKIPGASGGKLLPDIEAKIVDPQGRALPPGEIGELWSRSPSNALGYLGNAKATAETFDADGFIHTGDEVYIGKDDWIYVVDRIKELIKVSGFQVPPAELEGLLLDHPAVGDCCVIGILDERTGEKPKAYVTLSPPAQATVDKDPSESDKIAQSIKDFVKKNKIYYKQLAEVEFIPAIPKTASGKLLRKDLRVLHAQKVKSRSEKL